MYVCTVTYIHKSKARIQKSVSSLRCSVWPKMYLFTSLFTPSRGELSLMFKRLKGQTEGLHPWGITSPLWANFIPGGQISPLEAKLKTGLCMYSSRKSKFYLLIQTLAKTPIFLLWSDLILWTPEFVYSRFTWNIEAIRNSDRGETIEIGETQYPPIIIFQYVLYIIYFKIALAYHHCSRLCA
jgi:hypothetical protein